MIKTGICVSYDWDFLKKSLPRIYENSDIICLGIDKNRKTWKCEPYEFDEDDFMSFLQEIDVDDKIDLYEDDFALPNLNSRENCNRQRMKIAEKMGKGGWHVQIDSDEYFFDFKGFTEYLKNICTNPTGDEKGMNVNVNLIPLIKRTDTGYLFVDFKKQLPEAAPFATNNPNYERARHNGYFAKVSPFYVIHETWARSEDELWFKINNWGHASEELEASQKRLSYYKIWKSLDEYNYQYVLDFHPAKAPVWPALSFIEAKDIDELFQKYPEPKFPIPPFRLKVHNTKVHARLRQIGIIK